MIVFLWIESSLINYESQIIPILNYYFNYTCVLYTIIICVYNILHVFFPIAYIEHYILSQELTTIHSCPISPHIISSPKKKKSSVKITQLLLANDTTLKEDKKYVFLFSMKMLSAPLSAPQVLQLKLLRLRAFLDKL